MTMQSSPSKYTELILVVLMSSILAGDSIFATESRGGGSWRLVNNSYAQQLFRERKRGHFEYCVLKDDFLYCQAQSGMLFALARRGKDGSFELVQSELGESLAKTTHGKIELMGDPFLIESSADGDRLFVFFQNTTLCKMINALAYMSTQLPTSWPSSKWSTSSQLATI